MPVESEHPAITSRKAQWARCRDFSEGSDAVKLKGVAYLPKLSAQDDKKYAAYKARALFFNATDRTISVLTGAVMRKDPVQNLPDALGGYSDDITGGGIPLDEFSKNTVNELITIGRFGILVDRGIAENSRAHLAGYIGESIVNWTVGEDGKLSRVVLLEQVLVTDSADPYVQKNVTQYRELLISDGVYIVNIHTKADKDKEFKITDTITPTKRGAPLDEIPFIFINPRGTTLDIIKPPLIDLVDVNLSHYHSSADLEHGRHFTALPTPWVSGSIRQNKDDKEPTQLHIGAETAWLLEENGSAGFLEFTGQGLQSLEKALEQKETLMALLGARLLATPKRAAETAEKAKLDASGEGSSLSSIANSASAGIKKALGLMAEWEDIQGEISFELNTDFLPEAIDPAMLKELMAQVQGGLISYDTYFDNLKRGELVDQSATAEDEKEKIDNEVLNNVPPVVPDNADG